MDVLTDTGLHKHCNVCSIKDSCVQLSDLTLMRTYIPANINLNESASVSADDYVAKLPHKRLNSLISTCLGIISPRAASKWRGFETGQIVTFSFLVSRPPARAPFASATNGRYLVMSVFFCNFNQGNRHASTDGCSPCKLSFRRIHVQRSDRHLLTHLLYRYRVRIHFTSTFRCYTCLHMEEQGMLSAARNSVCSR